MKQINENEVEDCNHTQPRQKKKKAQKKLVCNTLLQTDVQIGTKGNKEENHTMLAWELSGIWKKNTKDNFPFCLGQAEIRPDSDPLKILFPLPSTKSPSRPRNNSWETYFPNKKRAAHGLAVNPRHSILLDFHSIFLFIPPTIFNHENHNCFL